ncbi:hypothetical protein ACK3SF_05280 [Candidatus Nanosalina sp. VS9-1]|uniref:hypothetical protein n=1 Tax=Candidatus Nanosalina sp. VS9-1 TaxID=3388566 RepID=UPI0039E13E10
MAVNALDILKHAFGSLKTPVGQKVVGLFFLVQALNIGGTLLMESGSGTMIGISVALSLVAALVGVISTIGGLRAFREGEFSKEMFTENLVWPFGRILGANITTAILAYALGFLFILPAGILAMLSGAATPSGVAASGGLTMILGILGLIMGLGAFFYVTVALILSQPLLAIDDRRLFQALDESIQRTKGHRSSIFVALLGLVLVYLLLWAVFAAIGAVGPDFITMLGLLVVGPIVTSASLSLLNYLTEELPEA